MADVIGWEGLVLPYGEIAPVGDPRVVLPTTFELSRPLPLPVKVQWSSAPGHDNAEQGLALITKVWSTDEGLWASGPIDVDDERGQRLARKVGGGFLGFVSADIETDGGQVINTSEGRRPAFARWRLSGVTLVGDPAFAAARIHPVTDPSRITPVDDVRRTPVQEFANSRLVTFTSGARIATTVHGLDDEPDPTPERSAVTDTEPVDGEQEFAVADPGLDAAMPTADTSGGISDADIARIADAVAARINEMDMAAQAEFQRISAARAALDEEEDGHVMSAV